MRSQFENGYTAYGCGLPYDPTMSPEWRKGWRQAEAYDTHGAATSIVTDKDLNMENNDYQAGYQAHTRGEPFDNSKSQEWQDGWQASCDDDRNAFERGN